MKTSIEEISPVKRKLTVEIEPEKVSEKVDKAYRALGKRAKIRGFRPGKAPRTILQRYFGKEVQEDVTKDLVNETLPKAMEETNIIPLSMPVVENEVLKFGQSFKYSAIMEVRPQFELKDYMGIEIEKEICSVTDEDVEDQIEEIRRGQGNLVAVAEDREVKHDDYVLINYEAFEGEEPVEGVRAENFLLRIGSGEFHPEFEESLLGLRKGDSASFEIRFEDNHRDSRLAGKEVRFEVDLEDIKVLELPELNDDFAKSLDADINDLKELKTKVREELTKREENRIERDLKKRLLNRISEGVEFELPESLVKAEIQSAIQGLEQNLMRSGSSLEKAGLSLEKLREEFRPASEKRVKDMLILGEIANQNNLSVDEAEVADGFKDLAERTGQDVETIRRYYEVNRLFESFRQRLLEEKTLNYLVKGAIVKDVEAHEINEE
ncbi:MAG: trigger factor [Deltaproteobacteria bacterium]|nr:trigger factor [Deltaproteobacteria bacterium]